MDIFNINCDCKNGEDVFSENVFYVNDNYISWQENSTLRIFSNPAYEFKSIISPGSSNAYQFVINNNNKFNVKYMFSFTEDNDKQINMKYRLKRNGEYIVKNYTSYDNLHLEDLNIDAQNHDDYLLEWKWIDAKNDTDIGLSTATYQLKITIKAEAGQL